MNELNDNRESQQEYFGLNRKINQTSKVNFPTWTCPNCGRVYPVISGTSCGCNVKMEIKY